MLPKDYNLGIVFEAETEDPANLERNAKIENNTECFTSIGRSKQEDNV